MRSVMKYALITYSEHWRDCKMYPQTPRQRIFGDNRIWTDFHPLKWSNRSFWRVIGMVWNSHGGWQVGSGLQSWRQNSSGLIVNDPDEKLKRGSNPAVKWISSHEQIQQEVKLVILWLIRVCQGNMGNQNTKGTDQSGFPTWAPGCKFQTSAVLVTVVRFPKSWRFQNENYPGSNRCKFHTDPMFLR